MYITNRLESYQNICHEYNTRWLNNNIPVQSITLTEKSLSKHILKSASYLYGCQLNNLNINTIFNRNI